MNSDITQLVSEIRATWPDSLSSAMSNARSSDGLALSHLIACANQGGVSSLPYIQQTRGRVIWLSIGPDTRSLLEYADDLRAWIFPCHDTEGEPDLVEAGTPGRLSTAVAAVSPSGYLRWRSNIRSLSPILEKLHRMHRFLQSKPDMTVEVVPSLSTLRFRFTTALRLGDWSGAEALIDEIDRWNLEQAQKTMQMRVRLLYARGAFERLVELVDRHQLWAVTNPRRISAAILVGVHQVLLRPLETAGRYDEALEVYRKSWFPQLTQAIADTVGMQEPNAVHAYAACIDNDVSTLAQLVPNVEPGLAAFIRSRLPNTPAAPGDADKNQESTQQLKPVGESFWQSLHDCVRAGRQDRLVGLLEALDSDILADIQFMTLGPDALLALFSDPDLEASPASRMLLQDTLTGLIDLVVDVPGFPRLQHLDLYVALCEGLVYLRGATASEADSQLLLGLVSAIIHLTPKEVDRCDGIIRTWWGERPTVSRLPWLAAALDVVSPLHPSPQNLYGLFSGAMDLAARKRHALTLSELRTWHRIADALEFPIEDAQALLLPLSGSVERAAKDTLHGSGLRRIAIVSLQETGAREAAKELAERTGAEVQIVNSLVQGTMTRAAATADLVLFVWAACSHSVYRAFDNCRDRLAYVQGTGAGSIIAAAEQWVQGKICAP